MRGQISIRSVDGIASGGVTRAAGAAPSFTSMTIASNRARPRFSSVRGSSGCHAASAAGIRPSRVAVRKTITLSAVPGSLDSAPGAIAILRTRN